VSYLLNLCNGFDRDDVIVVAPTREGAEEVDGTLPYRVVRLEGTYLRATTKVRKAITETVRDLDVDAVHFLAALPLGRLGPRLRKDTHVPFTVVAHGTGEILLPSRVPLARQALKHVLTSADVVFPVSGFTRSAVDRITRGKAKTSLLPPTVDTERFSLEVTGAQVRTELQLGSAFTVFFVSRLVKRKGADILLRAIAAVPDVLCVVGGAGPERAALERLSRELEITDRVRFVGLIPDEPLPEYYAAADVYCMPCTTRYGGLDTEGFGVVYIEAQATGIPSIAGRCGGSAEAVIDRETGIVLDDPTPLSVAEAIVALRNDRALAIRLGGAGRARMERDFAPAVAARRLEGALNAVTA
ncbi:MAG: glycosyltransferase family 4 protein, partial [Actinomycetota bacterium]